jgi:hypothetical protein
MCILLRTELTLNVAIVKPFMPVTRFSFVVFYSF